MGMKYRLLDQMKNIVVVDKEGLNAISGFAVNAFLQGAKPGLQLNKTSPLDDERQKE